MTERAPRKEIVDTGELFFLSHPGTDETFSSYGLVMQPGDQGLLVGLLMTDRPRPADLEWLDEVEPERLPHLCRVPGEKNTAIQTALQPLPANPPKPVFNLRCDEESRNWHSEFPAIAELSDEIRQALEQSGYGCVAAETNIGVVHVCHAADGGIEAFANKPVSYTQQLFRMPSAPFIRLALTILDGPSNPYGLESFLNVAVEGQARVLAQLAGQDQLCLAFCGADLTHHFTEIVSHDCQQWQYLEELVAKALEHWHQIPPEQRHFDEAKGRFTRRVP